MLSPEQRTKLMAIAASEGVDADALIAEAEAMISKAEPGGPLKFDRMVLGLAPYLTVNEMRAAAGLGPIAGGDAITGDWIAAHGGASSGGDPTDGEA